MSKDYRVPPPDTAGIPILVQPLRERIAQLESEQQQQLRSMWQSHGWPSILPDLIPESFGWAEYTEIENAIARMEEPLEQEEREARLAAAFEKVPDSDRWTVRDMLRAHLGGCNPGHPLCTDGRTFHLEWLIDRLDEWYPTAIGIASQMEPPAPPAPLPDTPTKPLRTEPDEDFSDVPEGNIDDVTEWIAAGKPGAPERAAKAIRAEHARRVKTRSGVLKYAAKIAAEGEGEPADIPRSAASPSEPATADGSAQETPKPEPTGTVTLSLEFAESLLDLLTTTFEQLADAQNELLERVGQARDGSSS